MIDYFIAMFELAKNGETQGIYFFIGIYTFVVCLYSVVFQVRNNNWPGTVGILSVINAEMFGSNQWTTSNNQYSLKALYHYKVGGKEYQGSRVSPWIILVSHNAKAILKQQLKFVEILPEGKVTVFYNPNKPEKSYLIKTGLKSQISTVLIGLTPLFFYYHKYYNI